MKLEEAIKTAIDYEIRVRDTYRDAADGTSDPKGKRVFEVLAGEEQGHVDYLESRLTEWRKSGALKPEALGTILPSREAIEAGIHRVASSMENQSGSHDRELRMLEKAMAAEIETGDFYKRMVGELDEEGRNLFARFLEIEEGHQTLVQAEIDSLKGTGFWFDMQEFDLEKG